MLTLIFENPSSRSLLRIRLQWGRETINIELLRVHWIVSKSICRNVSIFCKAHDKRARTTASTEAKVQLDYALKISKWIWEEILLKLSFGVKRFVFESLGIPALVDLRIIFYGFCKQWEFCIKSEYFVEYYSSDSHGRILCFKVLKVQNQKESTDATMKAWYGRNSSKLHSFRSTFEPASRQNCRLHTISRY